VHSLRAMLVLGPLVLSLACSDASGGSSRPGGDEGAGVGTAGAAGAAGAGDGGSAGDTGAAGGGGGEVVDKAALCTDTFGDALPKGYFRIDGTVLAVVQPKDTQCPLPNDDHVVLEITSQGEAYRMVVNVQSDRDEADIRVAYASWPHALLAPAWSEGVHPNVAVDYAADLGIHAPDFTPDTLATLSQRVADALTIGEKVSVYASSSGGASAHLIHKNKLGEDGAIVVGADGPSPRWLVFRFQTQDF
jgi:hypothetical protein